MKTQKEIQDRIDWLWVKITEYQKSIDEESVRWFPNKMAISFIQKNIDDMKAEVVHLSWVLI